LDLPGFKTGRANWQDKDKLGKGASPAPAIVFTSARRISRNRRPYRSFTAGYKEHGRFEPPHRSDMQSWSHPVVANGKLYLRDQDVLLCYDVGG